MLSCCGLDWSRMHHYGAHSGHRRLGSMPTGSSPHPRHHACRATTGGMTSWNSVQQSQFLQNMAMTMILTAAADLTGNQSCCHGTSLQGVHMMYSMTHCTWTGAQHPPLQQQLSPDTFQ